MEVLFEGSKTFWKTKNVINVVMIMHSLWDVVEIIAYDPVIDKEAPRLYVQRFETVVQQQVNTSAMSAMYASFHPNQTKDAERKAISSFLYNHLMIDDYLPVTRVLTIAIRSSFPEEKRSDVAGHVLGCAKPPGLVPYPSPFYSPLRSPKASQPSTPRTQRAPTVKLSARERMRLPIIFGKVTKGKSLSKADELTWIKFSRNKSSDELLANVATALAVRMPDEAAMLRRAAHALTLPENCPFPERSSASSSCSPSNKSRRGEKGTDMDMVRDGDSMLTVADNSPAVTPNNASRIARHRRRSSRSDTDSHPSSPAAVYPKRKRSLGAGSKSTDTDDSVGALVGSARSSERLDHPQPSVPEGVDAEDIDDVAQQRVGSGVFSSFMHSLSTNFAAMSFRRSPPSSSKVDSKVEKSMGMLRAKSADEADVDPRPKCVTGAVEEAPTRLPSAFASCSDLNAVRAKPKPTLGVGAMVGSWLGWGRHAAGSPYRVSPVPFAFEESEKDALVPPN